MRASVRPIALPVSLASLLVSACGGGGGGGGGPAVTAPTTPAPVTPTLTAAPPPSTTSAEYQRSWGLAGIHADAAFNYPATGKGVTIAVIDTGVDAGQPDLAGRVSASDIVTARNTPYGTDRHGTRVAGIAASAFNGTGTIGVAYEASILSIRADSAGCTDDDCTFNSNDVARAIDAAVGGGARVINLSMGASTPDGPAFEAALARAKAAGLVVAAAAGNDSAANPDWPARYAADSRFAGSVIAVGSFSQDGSFSSFSNRAGAAASGFLAAPGDSVVTDCENSSCWRVSGTSFASPHVAGALALLLQAFPNLSGAQAVDILLRSAADRGDAGTDAVWGRGALDLARAFSPIGALSVQTPGGPVQVSETEAAGGTMGAAMGDAVMTTSALSTVGRDEYQRLFAVDLARSLPGGGRALVGTLPATRTVSVEAPVAKGASLSLVAEEAVFEDAPTEDRFLDFVRGETDASVTARATMGRLSLTAWRGEGEAQRPEMGAGRDAFRLVAQPDHTMSAAWALGRWSFSAEQGGGKRREFGAFNEVDGASYVSGAAAWNGDALGADVTFGRLDEPQGPLGSDIAAASAFAMPARTDFVSVGVERRLAGLTVRAEGGVGRTRAEGALIDIEGALSSQWRLSAGGRCAFAGCSDFLLELEQPLRLERGTFRAMLADVPDDYFAPVNFSTRRFDASPSGREVDLRLTWRRDFGGWGAVRLRGVVATDPGHRDSDDLGLGGAVDWRVGF